MTLAYEVAYEVMALTADDGLGLNAFTAEPGSPSADALNLLASWAASLADGARAADRSGHTPTR